MRPHGQGGTMGPKIPVLFLSILAAGCSGLAVKQDYDTAADFNRLKSYAWQSPAQKIAEGDLANNSLVDARVRHGVNAALVEKGYSAASSGGTDFLVTYYYAVEKAPTRDQARGGAGFRMGSGGFSGGLGIGVGSRRDEQRETLTIDILDPQTGKLLWRGSAEQAFYDRSGPEKASARVTAMARSILAEFPPKPRRP